MRRLFALLLLAAPVSARAQTTEIQSAKGLGMGGAFRGAAWDNSAIDLNPAGMPQLPRFAFDGGYLRSPDTDEYALNVSFVDALTNRAATGFAFQYEKRPARGLDPGLDQQKYVLALGFPVAQDVYLGFNSKVIRTQYPRSLPKKKNRTIYTGDFGVLWRPFQIAAVGATFDNLVDGGHDEAPRSVTLGGSVLPAAWVAFTGDVFVDLETDRKDQTGWGLGVQLTPHRNISLRGGAYEHPLTHDRTWTAGIGLQGEAGAIDYAVRVPPEKADVITHYVTVSVLSF